MWFGDRPRICCGATSPNNRIHAAGMRRPASLTAFSASPPTTRTATPATARAGSSPASTACRRVTRTEHDGAITGDPATASPGSTASALNSPNDVVVKSDGSIWFTDPTVRHRRLLRGRAARSPELPTNVYRVDGTHRPARGRLPARHRTAPNGLCFLARREAASMSSESRVAQPRQHPRVRCRRRRRPVWPTTAHLRRAQARARPDGFRCDVHGNLWCGWGMSCGSSTGSPLFSRPTATMIGQICAARALRQSVLWRTQAKPPAHGGQPIRLRGLR